MPPDGVEDFSSEGQDGISGDSSLDGYMEEMEEDDSFADHGVAAVVKGRDNCLSIYDKVENFHLQCGASAVSIMQLPLCIGEEATIEADGEGKGMKEIYLVGQSLTDLREIRVVAEKWKLDLHPNCPPTFLVKTSHGWLRVEKPKVAYRRIMNDGLTLAHFLHFARKNPSASAITTREYLANQFRQFGEQPSLENLSDFFPVIRRYMKAEMKMDNPNILRELFPGYFRNYVVASGTRRDMKGTTFHDKKLPANGSTIDDLHERTPREDNHGDQHGVKSTSTLKTKKAQRPSVHAELRNLHSQWCTLLGGRATVKPEKKKKPVPKKRKQSSRQKSATRKPGRPKAGSKKLEVQKPNPTTPELETNVRKRGRPPAADRKNPIPKGGRSSSECETPVSKRRLTRGLTSTSSLESKSSILDQQPQKWKPLEELLNVPKSEGNTRNLTMNLRGRRGGVEPASLDSETMAPAPPSRARVGVHSPSTDIFDRLEDPPICTICDDGGDLICCEGPCQRHFHATPAKDSSCKTLGLTSQQVKKMDMYYCKNCLLKQHQCFICQELGSSGPSPLGLQQVYICDAPGCRKFYHAGCVAKVLDPEPDWRAMAARIERGLHGFLCPRHSCAVCMSKEIQPGIFVQCRRCPKAWHRDCLTDFAFSGELPTTSIWKHYEREFIYCKKHKILPRLLMPAQDHVRFPKD
ncbi:unnamed protein product [Calypogeia fissa]